MDLEEYVRKNKIKPHKTELTRNVFDRKEYVDELEKYQIQNDN